MSRSGSGACDGRGTDGPVTATLWHNGRVVRIANGRHPAPHQSADVQTLTLSGAGAPSLSLFYCRVVLCMSTMLVFPLLILALLALRITLPVTLPIASMIDWLNDRRLRVCACGMQCARCGDVLGAGSLPASDAAHRSALVAMGRQYPGSLVHVVRRARGQCTRCGAAYRWDQRRRTLTLIDDAPASLAATQ